MENTKKWLVEFTKTFAKENFGIDVKVKFGNSIRRWGTCYSSKNLIRYSNQFVEANKDNHEILRALAIHECCHFKECNHGKRFKELCKKYGVNSNHIDKTGLNINMPEPSKYYIYECPNCHVEIKRMVRMKQSRACGICCQKYSNGKYDDKFKIKLVKKVEKNV